MRHCTTLCLLFSLLLTLTLSGYGNPYKRYNGVRYQFEDDPKPHKRRYYYEENEEEDDDDYEIPDEVYRRKKYYQQEEPDEDEDDEMERETQRKIMELKRRQLHEKQHREIYERSIKNIHEQKHNVNPHEPHKHYAERRATIEKHLKPSYIEKQNNEKANEGKVGSNPPSNQRIYDESEPKVIQEDVPKKKNAFKQEEIKVNNGHENAKEPRMVENSTKTLENQEKVKETLEKEAKTPEMPPLRRPVVYSASHKEDVEVQQQSFVPENTEDKQSQLQIKEGLGNLLKFLQEALDISVNAFWNSTALVQHKYNLGAPYNYITVCFATIVFVYLLSYLMPTFGRKLIDATTTDNSNMLQVLAALEQKVISLQKEVGSVPTPVVEEYPTPEEQVEKVLKEANLSKAESISTIKKSQTGLINSLHCMSKELIKNSYAHTYAQSHYVVKQEIPINGP